MTDNTGGVDTVGDDRLSSEVRETDLSGQQCAHKDAGSDRHRSGPASFFTLSGETLAVGGMLMIMRLLDG